MDLQATQFRFALDEDPPVGVLIDVAPRVRLLRLPLPLQLNHVNAYVIEVEDGYAVLDTGLATPETIAIWEAVIRELDRPIAHVVLSHFHADHIGLAGWMCARTGARFHMNRTEFLLARLLGLETIQSTEARYSAHLLANGVPGEMAAGTAVRRVRKLVTPLPDQFERVEVGRATGPFASGWDVLTGGGHAVEQIMFNARSMPVFISADQVLAGISPNISVGPLEPAGDPLRDYLGSLDELRERIDPDVLVLPGHGRPFYGLHARIAELKAHHAERCDRILRTGGRTFTGFDLTKVIFDRPFPISLVGAATGEAIAHANYLVGQGQLRTGVNAEGIAVYHA